MLKFIKRCGYEIEKKRNDTTILTKYPFSSSRKRMSTKINVRLRCVGQWYFLVCEGR